MNQIPDDKFEAAVVLFISGKSVRNVAREVGIAKETAHRIQQMIRRTYVWAGQPFRMQKGGRGGVKEMTTLPPQYHHYLDLRLEPIE